MLAVKVIELRGPVAGDRVIAQVLADDAGVLGFRQGVIIAMTRPRLGELDVEFLEERSHAVVDVLRPVIGMKAVNDEGKGGQDRLQHGQQEPLTDALDGERAWELGDLIDGIDVINALDAIQIALVNRIQAQITRALRVGLAPHGDGRAC